jgi:hypothetical protein
LALKKEEDEKVEGKESSLLIKNKISKRTDVHYKKFTIGVASLLFALFHANDILNVFPKNENFVKTIGRVESVDTLRLKRNGVITDDPKIPERIYAVINETCFVHYLEEEPNYSKAKEALSEGSVVAITQNRSIKDYTRNTWQIENEADTVVKLAEFKKYYTEEVANRSKPAFGALLIGIFVLAYDFIGIIRNRSRIPNAK